MVLSAKFQVTEDDLLAHINALQSGKLPDLIAQAVPTCQVVEPSLPVTDCPPPKLSARQTHACPQLGQPANSPRRFSSILQSTAMTSLRAPYEHAITSDPQHKKISGCTRLDLMLRQETIPGPQSGRRFNGASSDLIRVYVKMPSIDASISMWVDANLPIHSAVHSTPKANCTKLKRQIARGWTKSHPGLGDEQASASQSPRRQCTWNSSPLSTLAHTVQDPHCLQDVIEQATGVPAIHQHLRMGSTRLDLNGDSHPPAGSTLRQCGLNHGCQIFMSDTNRAVHDCMVQQSQQNCTDGAWVMPRWQYSPKPHIFGQFPESGSLCSQSPYFYDYTALPDAPADACGAIRAGFTPRR